MSTAYKRPSAKTKQRAGLKGHTRNANTKAGSSRGSKTSSKRNIHDFYDFGEVLGHGSFGTVMEAFPIGSHGDTEDGSSGTEEELAVKIIAKKDKNHREDATARLNLLRQEITIMKKLNHENVVKLVDSFEDKDNVYMVMERMAGGELYEALMDRGSFSENDVRKLVQQICAAVEYLHNQGIIHRDLKPENLLLRNKDDLDSLKLTDFGLSALTTGVHDFLDDFAGTPLYLAPEIINGKDYDRKVDSWAIGVIMFQLLCGSPPFRADSRDELYDLISEGEYAYDDFAWIDVSDQAKDLIDRILKVVPSSRYSVSEILRHPWMTESDSNDEPLPTVVEMMKAFEAWRRLKRVANTTLAMVRMQKAIAAVSAFSASTTTEGGSDGSSSGSVTVGFES